MKKNKMLSGLGGLFAGLLNGMLGAGGGMIIVPMLNLLGVNAKKSHATSVVIILSICLVSSFFYLYSGKLAIQDACPYILWGVPGSLIGAYLLTKIDDVWLHRIFGLLMLWAAYRMLFK